MSDLQELQEMNRELRTLTLQIRDLRESGKEETEEYDALVLKKRQLKDQIENLAGI